MRIAQENYDLFPTILGLDAPAFITHFFRQKIVIPQYVYRSTVGGLCCCWGLFGSASDSPIPCGRRLCCWFLCLDVSPRIGCLAARCAKQAA